MEIGTRNWVIIGGSFGILTLLIVANQYEDRPRAATVPSPAQTAPAPEISAPPAPSPEEIREHALQTLEDGDEKEIRTLLSEAGKPGGARGKAVYAKLSELSEKGSLPGELACGALKRTGGSKAIEPITAILKSTDSRAVVAHCAVTLQDYAKAELLPGVLERLDALGMLERNGLMPWIDRDLLNASLGKAQGADLLRGMKVLRNRPSLVSSGMDALARGLEDADPMLRMTAAEAIKKAVAAKRLDPAQGRGLLAGRLDRETEPVLRAELTGGIEVAQGLLETETVSAQP